MLELIGLYKTFNPGTVNEKRAINGLNLTLADTLQKTEEVFFHKKSFRDGGSGNSVFSLIQGNRQNFLPTCL